MFNVCEVKNTFGIKTVTVFRQNLDGTFDTLAIRLNKVGMVKIDYPTTLEYNTVKRSFSVICGKDKQRRTIKYQMIPRTNLDDSPATHEIKVTSDYIRYSDAEQEIRRMSPETANDILDLLGDDLPNEKIVAMMAEMFGIPVERGESQDIPQTPTDRLAHVYAQHDGNIILHCVWRNGHHYGDFEDASKAQAIADSLNGVYQATLGETVTNNEKPKSTRSPVKLDDKIIAKVRAIRQLYRDNLLNRNEYQSEMRILRTSNRIKVELRHYGKTERTTDNYRTKFKTTTRSAYVQRELAEPISIY